MFQEIDMTDAKLEKEFGMGCLLVKGAHLWPLSHFVWEGSVKEVSATFFCEGQEPWDDISLLRIEVFKLPGGRSQLAERVEWYTQNRKKRHIKIADGPLFDESMLDVKGLASNWETDSFALSKREIIRIYQVKKYAVIFRFLTRSGTLLDHPVFKRVVKNVSFAEGQWEKAAPEVVDTRRKSKRTTESPLTEEQESEMWRIVETVTKSCKLVKVKDPQKRLEVVENEIKAARTERRLSKGQKADRAAELGHFLGQTFCWELEWEWCNIREPDGSEWLCVASPDRSVVMAPVDWVFELISDKKRPINCLLTFNMIDAGRLPPSRPSAYAWVG